MPRLNVSSAVRIGSMFPLWILLAIGTVALTTGNPIRPWLAWLCGAAALLAIFVGNPWISYEDGEASRVTTFLRVNSGVGLATLGVIGTTSIAGFIGNGTPPPTTRITNPLSQAAELLQYAISLDYDASHHAMDEDYLEVKQGRQIDPTIGPLVKVYPERSSRLNSYGDLAAGAGRIVAKFEVAADTFRGGIGHAKLRLPVGVSYLWIDSVSKSDTNIRAIIVSAAGAVRVPNAFYMSLGFGVSTARAQFQFDPDDPCVCESCMLHGWCRVCGN